MICNLCHASDCPRLNTNGKRTFHYCGRCQLISAPPHEHLSLFEEKQRYSHHRNFADNPDYVRYLTEFSREIDRIPTEHPAILDFGSGPEYVLARVLREKGMLCEPYDPLYGIGKEALLKQYDIVILCETIEHLRDLRAELRLCGRICKKTGYIVIRTQHYATKESVPSWWYAIDETHINFFNDYSFSYMASLLDMKVFYSNGKNTVIMGPRSR